jgi:hypothetical protein
MRKVRARHSALVLAIIGFTALAVVAPAFATASSAEYRGSIGPFYPGFYVDSCVRASIIDYAPRSGAQNDTWISPGGCSGTSAPLAAGWIGVNAKCYRDGAYMGQTGTQYTQNQSAIAVAAADLCPNPAGSQAFHTTGFGKIWIYQDGAYYNQTGVPSPNQNY